MGISVSHWGPRKHMPLICIFGATTARHLKLFRSFTDPCGNIMYASLELLMQIAGRKGTIGTVQLGHTPKTGSSGQTSNSRS